MSDNDKSWKDVLDLHFDKRLRDFVHTSFPAKITKVVNANVVDVLPLVSTLRPDESNLPYAELYDVRLHTYACQLGEVFISLPIKVGDLVWVMVSERDTFNLMNSNATEAKNSTTQTTHDMSDCFAIPAFFPDKNLQEFDPDNLVIANQSTKMIIMSDKMVTNTSEYELDAPQVTVTADIVLVDSDVQVTGELLSQTSIEAPTYKVGGVEGATGVFASNDGKTITVTKGLITSIV